MAGSNVNGANTVLTPEDVPGAQLIHENIRSHTCEQLKRWLTCRGLPKTGRKDDLVKRVENCIILKQDSHIDPAIDGGHWYRIKELNVISNNSFSVGKIDIEKVAELPIQWSPLKKDEIPELFDEGDIYHYLVETKNEGDEKGYANTSKPLRRADQYVKSGHVSEVNGYRFGNKFLISSIVKASMIDVAYPVIIVLSFRSGAVLAAGCKCKASALGKCSHVSATLSFVLELAKGTCTSNPCQWNQGSKKRNPTKIKDAGYRNQEYLVKKTTFDPRATEFRSCTSLNERLSTLLHDIEVSNGEKTCLLQRLFFHTYEDFVLDVNETLTLKKQVDNFLLSLYDEAERFPSDPHLVEETENQSKSSVWRIRRSFIFTASRVKDVLSLTEIGAKNFLRTNLWQLEEFSTEAVRYGLQNEDAALKKYKESLKCGYEDVMVEKTGLWISKKYPFIGGSPDGIVTYKDENKQYVAGLVEVKAPFILKGVHPEKFYSHLTKKQLQNFFLTPINNVPILKRSHKYYFQIQANLFIHKLNFCDLVVWSDQGITIERIDRDDEFFVGLLPKLFIKYRSLYVPEYFLQKTVRDLDPAWLSYT